MKKSIVIVLIMITFSLIRMTAQNPNRDKLNAYKIAFFTRKLNLSPAEAEKFWPVYNEFQNQKTLIQQDRMSIMKDFNLNESTLNDKQLDEMADKLVADMVKESNLAVTFNKKIKEVLAPAKVIKLYQAENQFKAELLSELKNARQQQKGMPKREF
jgi:hypothetical protein